MSQTKTEDPRTLSAMRASMEAAAKAYKDARERMANTVGRALLTPGVEHQLEKYDDKDLSNIMSLLSNYVPKCVKKFEADKKAKETAPDLSQATDKASAEQNAQQGMSAGASQQSPSEVSQNPAAEQHNVTQQRSPEATSAQQGITAKSVTEQPSNHNNPEYLRRQ